MSNSHLPNSHPDVVPNWIKPKYEPTPIGDAVRTSLVAGTDNVFATTLYKDWCGPGIGSSFPEPKRTC